MRLVLALFLALLGSGFAGFLVATVLAEWARGDQGYIIVFFALPVVILVTGVVFAICWASSTQRRTINGAAIVLAVIVAFVFAVLSAMTLGSGLERWMIWRDMQLVITIGASAMAVVVTQWLIFRWLSEPNPATGGEAGTASAYASTPEEGESGRNP
ncbi:MAG TPA: hypothetical protein GX405_05470 [Rhizobiales bacterium]|nr:hypothetical protein [Hyphomicrobiales bacterium]